MVKCAAVQIHMTKCGGEV